MRHIIVSEEIATVKFNKRIASETSVRKGYSKTLYMYVTVDHYKNYIASNYRVTFTEWARREGDEPVVLDFEYTMVDLAVDKYNELGR